LCGEVFDSFEQIAALWKSDALYEPQMNNTQRERLLVGWASAVGQVRNIA